MGLEVGIWALRVGFGPQDWDFGLEAGIWASRLRYGPGGWGEGGTKKEKKEEEEEKIPHMCESIGHRPLWGRCPAPSLNFNHILLKATMEVGLISPKKYSMIR